MAARWIGMPALLAGPLPALALAAAAGFLAGFLAGWLGASVRKGR